MKDIVFVLPFAGGSSNSFLCWNEITSYQFVFIDMPGKGKRRGEPYLTHFDDMVDEGFVQIRSYINGNQLPRYYIWG